MDKINLTDEQIKYLEEFLLEECPHMGWIDFDLEDSINKAVETYNGGVS